MKTSLWIIIMIIFLSLALCDQEQKIHQLENQIEEMKLAPR